MNTGCAHLCLPRAGTEGLQHRSGTQPALLTTGPSVQSHIQLFRTTGWNKITMLRNKLGKPFTTLETT